MTEYMFNPKYVTPETADAFSAYLKTPVSFRPIPMEYYTREMAIMAIRKPNHARPITYGDAPWTLIGAMLTRKVSE